MITVPDLIPLVSPVTGSIVAIDVLSLVQVPKRVASIKNAEVPTHMLVGPVMAAGIEITFTVVVTTQLVGRV